MSARTAAWLVALLLAATVGFVGYLFVVQNSLRTTQLSLNLGFAAWELSQPLPVVALVGGAFGAGLLLGLLLLLPGWARRGRKLRQLEQEIALGGATRGEKRAEWR